LHTTGLIFYIKTKLGLPVLRNEISGGFSMKIYEKGDNESHWPLPWVMARTDSKVKHYCLFSNESLRVTN
jgi:hypothetical protein